LKWECSLGSGRLNQVKSKPLKMRVFSGCVGGLGIAMRRNSNLTRIYLQSLFVILAAAFGATTARAVIPVAEHDALMALHSATNGAGWTVSTNWGGANGTECTWFGVTCDGVDDASSTTVTKLNLAGNGLNGAIPTTLSDLTGLTELYLGNNSLTGTIPPSLGTLNNLTTLSMYSNSLTGSIPGKLGDLSNLVNLSLSENELDGSIPAKLGGLSNLQTLYLQSNRLSGDIPSELAKLTELTHLSLHANLLTGAIPVSLSGLPHITWLSLNAN